MHAFQVASSTPLRKRGTQITYFYIYVPTRRDAVCEGLKVFTVTNLASHTSIASFRNNLFCYLKIIELIDFLIKEQRARA